MTSFLAVCTFMSILLSIVARPLEAKAQSFAILPQSTVVKELIPNNQASNDLPLLDGAHLQPVSYEEALQKVPSGAIVVLGEVHDHPRVAASEMKILNTLRILKGYQLEVGMEFLYYPDQTLLDQYRKEQLSEPDFLKLIRWGGMDFANYRSQIQFPNYIYGEKTLALNAPRSLTSKIAKSGIAALTEDEKKLMPPNFELGNENYRERFAEVMGGHVPNESLQKYFEAQSVWDDTMAWRVHEKSDPNKILVIVVGEFHVQYGGGLPDRLRIRNPSRPIITFSHININGLTEDEKLNALAPHARWGARADFLVPQDLGLAR